MNRLALALLMSASLATTAHAGTRRCAPVFAAEGDICDCTVHNYGGKPDTGVTIALTGPSANPQICQGDIPPTTTADCASTNTAITHCGCEVTGVDAATTVSLAVITVAGGPKTTVSCD